jgi:hypothetical protein
VRFSCALPFLLLLLLLPGCCCAATHAGAPRDRTLPRVAVRRALRGRRAETAAGTPSETLQKGKLPLVP